MGGAGTVKTYLALEKASIFQRMQKLLFAFYNEPIAKFCGRQLKAYEHVTVKTFHQLSLTCR